MCIKCYQIPIFQTVHIMLPKHSFLVPAQLGSPEKGPSNGCVLFDIFLLPNLDNYNFLADDI